jgi:hypothetical protein
MKLDFGTQIGARKPQQVHPQACYDAALVKLGDYNSILPA